MPLIPRDANHDHGHSGRVAGAVLFGLAAGAGLLALVYCVRRRARRVARYESTPGPLEVDVCERGEGYPLEVLGLGTTKMAPRADSPPSYPPALPVLPYSREPRAEKRPRRTRRGRRSAVTVHAADGGPVGEGVTVLPPMYDPAWRQ
jgi:hypothetical protein